MYDFLFRPDLSKKQFYAELLIQVKAVVSGQRFWVTNLANVSALLYHGLNSIKIFQEKPVNWAGFYVATGKQPNVLLLGPFQGKVACTQIRIGKGVCGTAAALLETQVVKDVHKFPGHIACDSESKSEIVVPLISLNGNLVGVLDIDDTEIEAFDEEDKAGLEAIVKEIISACDWDSM